MDEVGTFPRLFMHAATRHPQNNLQKVSQLELRMFLPQDKWNRKRHHHHMTDSRKRNHVSFLRKEKEIRGSRQVVTTRARMK